MKKFLVFLCTISLAFGIAGTAGATLLTNGDFETGDLTGWDTQGDVRVVQAGTIAGIQGMENYFALLGLEITDGKSTLRQDFDVTGIDELTISFNWAFDYWDNSASADDSFISFVRQDGKPAMKISLLDLTTHGTWYWPDFGAAYGYYSDTIDISAYQTDEARLVFRLIEESDSCWFTGTASVAGIDNVVVSSAPVPEPATMLLFGTGLVGLAGFGRKKFFKGA